LMRKKWQKILKRTSQQVRKIRTLGVIKHGNILMWENLKEEGGGKGKFKTRSIRGSIHLKRLDQN